ncbi:MAG: hypothetical protein HS126_21495 [Anaerolineales bacterium]|nr:hypothetical protein [Anaerolineales bacterium]
MNNYPHPRPTVPVQLYLLAGLSVFGLAALWLAAFHAFLQVASGPQAFFAATLIEAGLIIEALALIKRPKVWYIWIAVSISLVVSGTYNYIQAASMATGPNGEPTLNSWQLLTLALGPLSALCFVSLTLGYELREYQARLEKWQIDRATWLEQRWQEAEARQQQAEAERQAYLYSLQQAERERQEREAERRFQAEQEERAWQRHQQELAQRRVERRERLSEPAQPAQAPAQPAQSLLKCDKCPRTFGSQSALNAHRRFCRGSEAQLEPAVRSANGTSQS